jgi:hypothetical protein
MVSIRAGNDTAPVAGVTSNSRAVALQREERLSRTTEFQKRTRRREGTKTRSRKKEFEFFASSLISRDFLFSWWNL